MNAVEIEQAITDLAEQPFDSAAFQAHLGEEPIPQAVRARAVEHHHH